MSGNLPTDCPLAQHVATGILPVESACHRDPHSAGRDARRYEGRQLRRGTLHCRSAR
jgi:hypothetical protein